MENKNQENWEKRKSKELNNLTFEEWWKMGKEENLRFIRQLLKAQRQEIIEKIRLRMLKEANTPLNERKSGWDILKEVRDLIKR